MSQPWDHAPAWAAEFPNDNPALHEGVSWVCLSVCGPVKPVLRPRTATSRPLRALASLTEFSPIASREPSAAAPSIESPAAAPEPLPESVLSVLLERLDLDFTPSAVPSFAPAEDVLEIDASDLEPAFEPASPAEEARMGALAADASGPFAFDGGAGFVDGASDLPPPPEAAPPEPVVTEGAATVEPAAAAQEPAPEAASLPSVEVVSAAPVSAVTEPDAHAAFVDALVAVLLSSGATRAAAVLPSLLDATSIDAALLDADSALALASAKIADAADGHLQLTSAFVATAQAWRDVLRGRTNDLSACGTSTLDGWAADLLRALGVGREGKVDVRRELRRRGVAAFGMLHAA